MRPLYLIAGATFILAPTHASALNGDIDSSNQYPYVVRIWAEYPGEKPYGCSGIVRNRAMVVTAGHCVYSGGYSEPIISVDYTNSKGIMIRRTVKRIFLNDSYKAVVPLVERLDADKHRQSNLTKEERIRIQILASQYDLAILLPEFPIDLREYAPSTIMDEDLPFTAALSSLMFSEEPWSTPMHQDSMRLFVTKFEPRIVDKRALVIGYGSTTCTYTADDRLKECKDADGKRRYTLVSRYFIHSESIGDAGRATLFSTGDPISENRILRGDSGGPLFVRDSITGSLRLIGISSRSNRKMAVFASLVQNAQLWKKFESDPEYQYRLKYEEMFGVISVVLVNTGPKRRLSAGMGIGTTKAEAEKRAQAECSKGRVRGCRIAFAFGDRERSQCAFIAIGQSRNLMLNIGIGSTASEALARCRKGRFSCHAEKVAGMCTH